MSEVVEREILQFSIMGEEVEWEWCILEFTHWKNVKMH